MIRCIACLAAVVSLQAAMVTHELRYALDGTEFVSTATWSDAHDDLRPLVLMIPNWMGPSPASLEKAQLLAGERYVVVMADVYGADVRPTTSDEAGAAAGALRKNRGLLRQRANLALAESIGLVGEAPVDPKHTAAIGFCFGGGTVLEMARSGTALDGVVSFHGNLDTPDPSHAANIRTSILVCHGAADPLVPREQVTAFEQEMAAAEVDWQLIEYGGAVHSFTNPNADSPGRAMYHELACQRAFALMHSFLAERFAAD